MRRPLLCPNFSSFNIETLIMNQGNSIYFFVVRHIS